MSGKKQGKKGRSGGNLKGLGGGTHGSLKEQFEALLESDPRYEKLFGANGDFSVDGKGNFTGCSKNLQREFKHRPSYWYKDNAENKPSADTFAKGSSHHHQRESVKERKMDTGSNTGPFSEAMLRAKAEELGKMNKDEAIIEALRQGMALGQTIGNTEAAARGAKDATKEAAKGIWAKTKQSLADKKTAVGIMLGVAGCVAATAGVKAYKDRQGQRTMRVGDTIVSWDGTGPAPAGATAGGGGNQGGGAPMGNDNGRGNRGGGR